jgi:methionyl-tRNA formyltransferase
MRIIFMGTPDFAVASLDALVSNGFNVISVVTAPDKPAGRGLKLTESAVKQYAIAKEIPVLQPIKLKDPEFISALKDLKADIQIVVAFRMLPEIVWNMPPMGTLNVHGSLLPQYRGAAPINWAVINGEKETGVTTFKLKHEIDTGDILLQESMPIGEDETATEVHDRMKIIGANLLVKTLQQMKAETIQEKPQVLNAASKHAPKIFTTDCTIQWNQTVEKLHNLVRGLAQFPGAITQLDGKILKVYKSQKELMTHQHAVGKVFTDYKTFLKYSCTNGYLHILDLQLEGKKRMPVTDFLRGYKPTNL